MPTRRLLLKTSVLGLIAASSPKLIFANQLSDPDHPAFEEGLVHDRYPAIKLEIASEVVGVSHFDLNRLKALVDPRPELAKAVWDFGFGDWESAIAAASHVGRIDIINYLVSKGAVPTLFTYATLGNYSMVKNIVETHPGIQRSSGPHGISLLQHAKTGLASDNGNKEGSKQLVDFLEKLGDADGPRYLAIDEAEKNKYIGDYIYDPKTQDGFTVKLNARKNLSLGKKGKNGGNLYKIAEHTFTYNGAVSVSILFKEENGKIVSLTINEPGFSVTAIKQG